MKFFVDQGLFEDVSDVWESAGFNFIVYKIEKCEYYELYVLDNNKEIIYDKLYIKTIEQSKLMEDMFNNDNRIILECFYDKKRGWIPNKKTNNRIASLSDIKSL